jgi:hypothetical protein
MLGIWITIASATWAGEERVGLVATLPSISTACPVEPDTACGLTPAVWSPLSGRTFARSLVRFLQGR